ncbi:MAG: NAD(P)-binding protein [Spirochaetes bacterium]|nr:NAD(P)-binding protein [Spirochaetota bacterium]
MDKKDQTIILGAGLSGLTAAIVLAREGRAVKVIERAKDIGGDLALHPSLHATPINIKKVKDWTGLNPDKMFVMGKKVTAFTGTKSFNSPPVFLIERGKRPTSIDTYLYGEAKKLGVEFEFNHHVNNPKELPKGSIIATGFYPDMFDIFKTPCHKARGFFVMKKNTDPALEGTMYLWMGPYTEDYAYACILNELLYIALFSRFNSTAGSMKNVFQYRSRALKVQGSLLTDTYLQEQWETTWTRSSVSGYRGPFCQGLRQHGL